MHSPLDAAVFPKVLVHYAPMASVYEALAQVLPPDVVQLDARAYVDRLAKDAINDAVKRMTLIADDLTQRGLLNRFRQSLARLERGNNVLNALLADSVTVANDGRLADAALQSIQSRMEMFINAGPMQSILDAGPRVCAILVDDKIAGTGFLVGADLVMTARHVIEGLVDVIPGENEEEPERDEAQPGSAGKLACVFDYVGTLYKPFPRKPPPPGITVEALAPEWLVWSSNKHRKDGVGHQFDFPPDIRRLFDCALIRLARPVGNAALDATGSQTRGWLRLDDELGELTGGQKLALWQHPSEGPRVWGDGNFMVAAPGGTRIWYSAPASYGSSGAPCFDSQSRVVAFHNAGYPTRPEPRIDTRKLNQGVPLAPLIKAMPKPVLDEIRGREAPPAILWSLGEESRDPAGRIHPVLGRQALAGWIATMAGPAPAKRVIVVEEEAAGRAVGRSGKSFSGRILRAMMLSRPGLVILLEAEKIKDLDPDAFLTDLAGQAGILAPDLPMPAKPLEERQLTRWWANDLPNWFALLVEEAARRSGAVTRDADAPPGEDDDLLLAPTWIVIDDIHKHPPAQPMRESLAGMIGITESTTTLAPGLSALRWLIIGNVPDFIRELSIEHEHDKIAQRDIGEADWLACCEAAFQAEGLPDSYDEADAKAFYAFAVGNNPVLEEVPLTGNPQPAYLESLARAAGVAVTQLLKKARQ